MPKWNPLTSRRIFVEINDEIYKQRLEELSEIFYDAFCELQKDQSIEPELNKFCDIQNQKKAG